MTNKHIVEVYTRYGYAEVDLTQFDGLPAVIDKEEKELGENALKDHEENKKKMLEEQAAAEKA